MYTAESQKSEKSETKQLFSWQLLVLKVLLLALVAVLVEKPSGVLTGRISLAEKGFGLKTYDIRENKVYVIAEGPRNGPSLERGVWVQPDGSFKFDHLPVGEYQIRVRAKGFESAESYGLFVEEGKVTTVKNTLALNVLEPSVSLAQTSRVFTTQDVPSLFINAVGATTSTVKLYKADFIPLIKAAKPQGLNCANDLNIYSSDARTTNNPLAKQKPLQERQCKLELDWTDSAHASVNFGKLAPGDYFVYGEVTGVRGDSKASNFCWFNVSDVGLIVKRDASKVLIQSVNLQTLQPVANCSIRGYNIESEKYVTADMKTGANGILEIRDPDDDDDSKPVSPTGSIVAKAPLTEASIFVGHLGSNTAYDAIDGTGMTSSQYKGYFYTDKPIYRLGQTVCYKNILRQVDQGQLVNPGATLTLEAHVDDPTNNTIWKGTVKTNKFGAFSGTFRIPEDGKTGVYQLITEMPDGTQNYSAFEVDQYRKPEYLVEVTPLTPRIVSGQKLRMQVKASYFFGAPVANASVKYTIYSNPDFDLARKLQDRPDYYDYYDDWSDSEYYASGGEYVSTGTAQTDENGLATVEFDTANNNATQTQSGPYTSYVTDKKYRVEAEVTDISRLTQVGSGTAEVTAGDFALFVQSDADVVKAGDRMEVTAQAVSYDGKPVANQAVTLSVERWTYDSTNNEYKAPDKVAEIKVTTDAKGKATAAIQCKDQWPSDTFYVVAKTTDGHQHTLFNQHSVWIASESFAYQKDAKEAEKQAASITADKHVYRPGDKAKLMITAPVTGKEGIKALVTVEGAKIYQSKLVALDATAKYVEILVTDELAPNAFISVAFVGNKHQFYTAEQMIKVSPEKNFLKLAVTSDKDRYKPGDSVHYTIKATNADGTPAPNTDLSLGVVDESIYSIRGEQAEDIQKFFYARRDNIVLTACSFPVWYSAGPDKIEPKVRKDFKDTAAWIPDLITNKDGIAQTTVKLPDNLTSWRATVRGATANTAVGSTTQKVLCTQDLILRLALPRFFTEGDKGFITAIVHNYTKQPQSVKLSLKASSEFAVNTDVNQTATVAPEKAFRYNWPVTLVKSGKASVQAKAIGQTAGDAMEVALPVNPLGLPAFSLKSGLLTDDNAHVQLPVGMSADAVAGTQSEKLTLASSTIGPVLGNFNALIEYPYGCTEQTLSKLVPSMVAMQLHKKLNIPITNADAAKFAKVQKLSLEKLRSYHHPDGGWGWWASDESNPYLTAHVVSGLSLLKDSGYADEDVLINSGLRWLGNQSGELQRQLADAKIQTDDSYARFEIRLRKTDLAKMLYTMSSWGSTPESLFARFAAKTKPPVLSYHSELSVVSNPDTAGGAGQASAPAAVATPNSAACSWLLGQTDKLAPEALSYLVLTCKNLGDEKGAKQAYTRLLELSQKESGMTNWDHTAAMAKKFSDHTESYEEHDYRFTGVETTALGLEAVVEMEPGNTELIEGIKQWLLLQRDNNGWQNTKTTAEVFMALLKEELQFKAKAPINFQAKVTQSGQQLFNMAYTSANAYGAEQTVQVKLSKDRSNLDINKDGGGRLYYTALATYFRKLLPGDQTAGKGNPVGLTVTRKFYRLKALPAATDGTIRFKTEEIVDHKINAGETIMMKTFVHCPTPLPYVKVESALPSGAEVVSDGRQDNIDQKSSDTGPKIEGDWGTPWWTHQDILDDRIVYFGAVIPRGDSEFHTMLRMELPGTMEVMPVTFEGMYTNKVRAYSALDQLTIKE
ncbi:MAG TPA: MG2 domain-containing protein [Oculatellaceae cyanobacterium]